ncbi:DDE superfamily endonuclease domain-containing protein [Phthorimaea operculella]|nr:DDE superfamily endonuclease domain-containing protein [Phthorimaea operculella]
MPRNYVKKPKTYSELKLQEALEKVQSGELSYREAESKYNVDKSLLWRKVHNYNMSTQGRKTVLSEAEEADLAEKIQIMAKWGWALTRKEIREIVHAYVCENDIKNNFKDNYPGKDWLQMFLSRNGLVAKKMEQLEKSRRQATSDPFIVYHFYEILDDTLTALNLHDKPDQVFNLDETSFSADPTRIKGVTGKGQKAHRIIQGSGKDNTTVLGCVSAGGRLLPPLIIFKGQNLWNTWKGKNDIPNTTYVASENGWMLSTIFNMWFEKFCKLVTERPLLVIFDGHVTHLDPATIELAVRENVALLKLPPHTTDVLQPMDRSLFGPIKYRWNERLIEWQRLNQRSLTKSEFSDLLCEVWREGLSEEVIKNSFKVTGIYPVNKDAYPKDRLDPVKLDRYYKIQASSASVPHPLNIFEESPDDIVDCVSPSLLEPGTSRASHDVNQEQETHPTVDLIEPPKNVQEETPAMTPPSNGSTDPCCSSASFESLLLNKIKYTKPATGKRRKVDGKGRLLTSEEYLKSIENLEAKKKKTIKPKKKTTEPKKKITGPKKKKPKTTMRKSDSDTDTGEEEVPYADESDVDNISLSEIAREEQDEEVNESHKDNEKHDVVDDLHRGNDLIEQDHEVNESNKENNLMDQDHAMDESGNDNDLIEKRDLGAQKPGLDENFSRESQRETQVQDKNQVVDLEFGIGDFILVVHTTKKKQNFYIARVEGSDDEENLSVIYLKRTKKIFFAYPDTHIIYSVHKDEIVMKLPSPIQKNKRGALMFDVDLEKYNIK